MDTYRGEDAKHRVSTLTFDNFIICGNLSLKIMKIFSTLVLNPKIPRHFTQIFIKDLLTDLG
jgi:hypothetical protein